MCYGDLPPSVQALTRVCVWTLTVCCAATTWWNLWSFVELFAVGAGHQSRARASCMAVSARGASGTLCESIDGYRMSSRLRRCEHRITNTRLILPTSLNWLVKTWAAPFPRQATLGGAGAESRSRRRLIHFALFVNVVPVDLCCQLCCSRRLRGPLFIEAGLTDQIATRGGLCGCLAVLFAVCLGLSQNCSC
jgi:hypothetical protein